MSRFVILRHESPQGLHFDLMLELGDVLKTWALPQSPQPGLELPCEALPDHRLAYLDYEGPISGQRGSVTQWDRGTYTLERQNEAEWKLDAVGKKVVGSLILRKMPGGPVAWTLRFVASNRAAMET